MSVSFKRTYRFAVKSSLYITFFATGMVGILTSVFFTFSWKFCLIFALGIAIFSFFVLQYRVERFIYRRVKKIYDDVSLLESTNFRSQPITTDMATLTKQVKKFATDKKLEIETLKVREEYRREFIGNVSHELKTPLFTVQGYLSTLLDGGMKDKTIRKKYLQRAEKGVERLIYIVQDLDMITKLEAGELNLVNTRFDILEVIQNVFDLLEMKASEKNILLMFDLKYVKPIYVYGDKEKIQQVVTNLVVNSIKYGKEDGTTEVSVEDLVNNKVIVRIMDNGDGIEKQHIPRLFERFYRIDKSGARSEGGSGLGLSIVKHIIEAHDEKIYVESQVGKGSEFSFTLEKTK
ncbi:MULTISPECIES: sensor histidine kinase [Flavobacterium]|jgi:two-component system phosphate regulon sensor histidine kinase PhoR|uniref:histidine kinase n=1 Tax=Flavobacterium lindanitolerans TaxID=428988 RepID=A0A497UXM9_9FLAO|nr:MULTISPECIES: ATP-binding protein [Flavobacterium]PZO34533.1 MAG: sensor histidine kinase [Flavobacteriaceae bacterium]PZQ87738.1 MAG: sensor histidine kinase [Flavobacterium johnsoniae]KQS46482.1 histidine kinase [Flavobacterium sp. Leaf359]MBC8643642.1 sensor histidine kinase [Flavobacterium lindanitolerans]MDQ7959869.1 ATP-binding protein [Flavobacterium lindanitolerans]